MKAILNAGNYLALCICLLAAYAQAQVNVSPDTLKDNGSGAVQVTKLAYDSLCSTFCILIPNQVKAHFHAHHTENVVISEGTGIMRLGEREFPVKPGDVIVIPKGTVHSVRSTGTTPLKVISVQSPYFDGKDRVMVE